MIYGYLRVSSDEQDVNNQKQGVIKFAEQHEWKIEAYITDEGISGTKDPSKRALGKLLMKIKKGDIIICSEISRLGRNLLMIMSILQHIMKKVRCFTQSKIIMSWETTFKAPCWLSLSDWRHR